MTVSEVETSQYVADGGSILELDDVGKSYGNVHALRGVNIRVGQGEVTCVLGDNGAGKSTLIKIMTGIHPADLSARVPLVAERSG